MSSVLLQYSDSSMDAFPCAGLKPIDPHSPPECKKANRVSGRREADPQWVHLNLYEQFQTSSGAVKVSSAILAGAFFQWSTS